MASLIQKLKDRQGSRSQMDFASDIGITQSALSRIYSGDRQIGVGVGKKIKKRFPELAFDVAAFLLADNIPVEHKDIPV